MTRPFNTHHNRSRSRYPDRLRERGETGASVKMPRLSRASTAATLGMPVDRYDAHCQMSLHHLDCITGRGKCD